jgi:hypothetical protein
MGIMLLGECWPYRAIGSSWDNSQGRLFAKACGLTVEQLQTLCHCRYVLNSYVMSAKKDARYERRLEEHLQATMICHAEYSIHLLLGLRMSKLLGFKDVDFFEPHFWNGQRFACVPNPLAEYWWKEQTNVSKVGKFMAKVFAKYTP